MKPPRKGKKYTPARRQEIIAAAIKEQGWNTLHKKSLAAELGVSMPVFYEDVDAIIMQIKNVDMKREGANVKFIFDKNEERMEAIIDKLMHEDVTTYDGDKLANIIDKATKLQERKAACLEAFGMKGKIADELHISGQLTPDYFNKVYEDMQKDKKE